MQITIIGLGLIGCSVGLALKTKHGDKVQIVGYDSDQSAHNDAPKLGAIDRAEWNLDDAVEDAEVIVAAAPANAVYDIFEAISNVVQPDTLVVDTSASKRAVTDWAEELLPSSVDFVGINPLVGGGYVGQKDAHPTLFEGKRIAVMPSVATREGAVKSTVQLIEDLGARAVFMDIDEHDSFSAAVNGLPLVVAASLLSVASTSPSWREISRFADSTFHTITSAASNDPALGHATAITNPDMMVHWIDQMINVLGAVRDGIADEETRYDTESPLADIFVNAWEQKLRLEHGIEPEGQTANPLPTAGEATATLLLGRIGQRLMERTRERQHDPTKYDRRRMR